MSWFRLLLVTVWLFTWQVYAHADAGPAIRAALASGQPALIEFGAETCSQCRRMKVVLDAMARRYQGRAHVVQVNVNRDQAVTRQYKIMVIPTLVFFDARGREVARHYGFMDEVAVARRLYELGAH
jgi:thioredoxin 1